MLAQQSQINLIKLDMKLVNLVMLLKKKILKGEKIFINTKYNEPFSDKYFFKNAVFNLKTQNYIAQDININFKKDIFGNKNNDPRFKGLSSSSKNGVTIINKGVFTTCKKNDECPPWSIQADKITYDENKKLIRLHPRLKQEFVPFYVLELTLYHEMCHQFAPSYKKNGLWQSHHPEFKKKEKEYRNFKDARNWEKNNWHKLLLPANQETVNRK